jgi:hypothetical protein
MYRRPTAARLESQSVLMIECTIPPDSTIAEWRRGLPSQASAHRSLAWLTRLFYRRASRLA